MCCCITVLLLCEGLPSLQRLFVPRQVCGTPAARPSDPWNYRSYFVVANLVLCFAVPVVLLVWIYTRIYLAAQQNSERTRRNSLCGSTLDAVTPSRGPSRCVSP